MSVHFIGAGPGAPDLITVRGLAHVRRVGVVLYAGSLVPKAVVAEAKAGARVVDTAPLTLDEIVAEMAAAHATGQDVARLHSGDPSFYGAIAEQMRRLDAVGIPYDVTPGVPAFAAAAAALIQRFLYSVGMNCFAFCRPSRGPTSLTSTSISFAIQSRLPRRNTKAAILPPARAAIAPLYN